MAGKVAPDAGVGKVPHDVGVGKMVGGALGGSLLGLKQVQEQQQSLAGAVWSGRLWMEEGVAERAAARCDQVVDELNEWLFDTDALTRRRAFGANADGEASAARFVRAGQDYVAVMTGARGVFEKMAATFRAAGRTAAQAEDANRQTFSGGEQ